MNLLKINLKLVIEHVFAQMLLLFIEKSAIEEEDYTDRTN